MSLDYAIGPNGDMTGGFVTGQDEILQRIETRLRRLYKEWFVNTSVGMPWYAGDSKVIPGELSTDTALLGSHDIGKSEIRIRREIEETDGVINIIDFHSNFVTLTRELRVRAKITTQYGIATLRFDEAAIR